MSLTEGSYQMPIFGEWRSRAIPTFELNGNYAALQLWSLRIPRDIRLLPASRRDEAPPGYLRPPCAFAARRRTMWRSPAYVSLVPWTVTHSGPVSSRCLR